LFDVGDDDPHLLAGKGAGHGKTDPTCPAGDDRHLAFECLHPGIVQER
jgi:hypothetical protein